MTTDLWQVFDDLVRFETMLWNSADRALREQCGLTLGGLNALEVVERTPDCRVFDIARALAITVGGASQAIDRLETAGHLRRRANPTDRRSSILELTEDGQVLLAAARPVFGEVVGAHLRDQLPAEALADLGATLHGLREALAST